MAKQDMKPEEREDFDGVGEGKRRSKRRGRRRDFCLSAERGEQKLESA